MTQTKQNKSAFNRRKKKENEKFFLIFEKATKEKVAEIEKPVRRGEKGKELIEGMKKISSLKKMT